MTRAIGVACAVVLVAGGALAQAAGPFDGKWDGESLKCTPAANTGIFRGIVVKNNRIVWTWNIDNVRETCSAEFKPDGSFENKTCKMPIDGKASAKKIVVNFKTASNICSATAIRP